jgi:hypothetical protein
MPFESLKFWKSPEKGGKKEEMKSAEEIAKEIWEGKEQKERKEKPKTPEEIALATIDKMAKKERLKNIGKTLAGVITSIGMTGVLGFLAAPHIDYVAQFSPWAAAIEAAIVALPGVIGMTISLEKGTQRASEIGRKVEEAKKRLLEALRERKIEK